MNEQISGLDELTVSLIESCSSHRDLFSLGGEVIKKIIDVLVAEQFSKDDRKEAQRGINKVLDNIVNRLHEENNNAD